MIHKSKSLPNYLNKITHSLKNSKTFHDFNKLNFHQNINYCSYGLFLIKYPYALKSHRLHAIQKFYSTKI